MNRGQRACCIEERASVKTRRTEDRMVHLLTGKRFLTAWVQRDRWVYAGVRVAGWASQSGTSGKEPVCQCRRPKRCGFDPWGRKAPRMRIQQPTPVFLPGESLGQISLAGFSP